MENSYWRFVEPVWDAISIYDGGKVFLDQFSNATEKQQVLFASHWAQSEILDGGLGLFFCNSAGILALGMPKCAKAIEHAMLFFGEPYPREHAIRQNKLEEFFDQFGEDSIPLEEYEDIIASEIETENGGFEATADAYANQG
jgi:hypothetical protein